MTAGRTSSAPTATTARAAAHRARGRRGRQRDFLREPETRSSTACSTSSTSYGGVDAINRAADEAGGLENRLARLRGRALALPRRPRVAARSSATPAPSSALRRVPAQRPRRGRRHDAPSTRSNAVTLEISALQYFPWLIAEAERAIERRELHAGPLHPRAQHGRAERAGRRHPRRRRRHADHRRHATSRPWTRAASTAATSTSAARTPSPATSAASASPTTTRSSGPTSTSTTSPSTASARCSTSTSAPSWSPCCCTSSACATSSRSRCSWASTTPWSVLWLLMGARLLAGRGRLHEHGRPQPLELGRARHAAAPAPTCAQALGLDRRGALRAPRDRGLQEHRAAALRPPRRRRARPRPPCRTSAPSTRAATPAVEAGREHPSDIFDYFLPLEEIERAASCRCWRPTTSTSTRP